MPKKKKFNKKKYIYTDDTPFPSNCWFVALEKACVLVRCRDDCSTIAIIEIQFGPKHSTLKTAEQAVQVGNNIVKSLSKATFISCNRLIFQPTK